MKLKMLASAAALLSCADLTCAEETATTTTAEEPRTIVVIGQGESRQTQTLSNDDLSLKVSGTSPIKLIASLPGVNYTAADPFGAYEWATDINIRGFQKNQLGYTLDGIPLGEMS